MKITQRRLGGMLLIYDTLLVIWLVYKSVDISRKTSRQASIEFTPYLAATFAQSGLTLATVPTFLIANLDAHVRRISNLFSAVLLIRGSFITPLILFNFVKIGKMTHGILLALLNAATSLFFVFILWTWAINSPYYKSPSTRQRRGHHNGHHHHDHHHRHHRNGDSGSVSSTNSSDDDGPDGLNSRTRLQSAGPSSSTIGPFENVKDLPSYEDLILVEEEEHVILHHQDDDVDNDMDDGKDGDDKHTNFEGEVNEEDPHPSSSSSSSFGHGGGPTIAADELSTTPSQHRRHPHPSSMGSSSSGGLLRDSSGAYSGPPIPSHTISEVAESAASEAAHGRLPSYEEAVLKQKYPQRFRNRSLCPEGKEKASSLSTSTSSSQRRHHSLSIQPSSASSPSPSLSPSPSPSPSSSAPQN